MKYDKIWQRARSLMASAESRYDIGIAVILGSKLPSKVFETFADRDKFPNPGSWTVRKISSLGLEKPELVRLLGFCKEEARNDKPSPVKVAAIMLGYTEYKKAARLAFVVRSIRRFRREGLLQQEKIVLQHLNENGISSAADQIKSFNGSVPSKKSLLDIVASAQELLRSIKKDCPTGAEYPLDQSLSWVNALKESVRNR